MVKEFVELWEGNKKELENYFRDTKQSEYCGSYSNLFKLVLDKIINNNSDFNFGNIKVLDDGDYQGTQILIANLGTYQPCTEDYIYTNTYYGSCSGCDTLLGICDYNDDELPDEQQIKGYMLLCLHLLQKIKYMGE